MSRLRLPGPTGRAALGLAAVAWVGALAGGTFGAGGALMSGVGALAAAAARRWVSAVVIVAAACSGWAAAARVAATFGADVAEGPVAFTGRIVDEPLRGAPVRAVLAVTHRRVDRVWAPVDHPNVAVVFSSGDVPTAGDVVVVRGTLRSGAGTVRGDPVAATVVRARIQILRHSSNPLFTVGNALRSRVASSLDEAGDPRAALLSGFLIGETAGLAPGDIEALRRAGLSHFVAVSGSNVALFLAAWWVVTAPLAVNPRLRSVVGLVGLALFVVVTRWEPSVVRAAAMAGLVLGSRALGRPIDAWTALGAAVAGLLLMSGDLAASVGFQLSVAATIGVMGGASLFAGRRPRWLWLGLGATLSAQIAVTPLLLAHFGTVPLLSPVANLLAAPLVTMATAVGGVAVVAGASPLVDLALVLAGGVLWIATTAAQWPQLSVVGVGVVAVAVALSRVSGVKPAMGIAAAAFVFAQSVPLRSPPTPTVTFLDVGQGDAVLLRDGGGTSILVDGGRDPGVLGHALRRRGVHRIDLLVVSHGDADHVGGLEGLVDGFAVSEVWISSQPHQGPLLEHLVDDARRTGIPVLTPEPGFTRNVGAFRLRIEGPLRRYQSDNDASVVLWVEASGRTLLLPGDIEAVAQRELSLPRPDVLLVPHHGSATSDVGWLRDSTGRVAIISVGENPYGHPSGRVTAALEDEGARVWTTLDHGDIEIPLG